MSARIAAGLVLLLVLGACATPEPAPPAPPPVDTIALVAAIRAAAGPDEAKDELAIRPLRDPMVEDARQQAQQLERAGQYVEAAAALDAAIAVVPDDPALLQERAEAAVFAAQFDVAESFALRAHGLGAQVGPLCRRHWATVRVAREQRGNATGAAEAGRQLDACKVSAPPRY